MSDNSAARSLEILPAMAPTRPARWIAGLAPYDAVASRVPAQALSPSGPFKLDWNEATIPPSPVVQNALLEHITGGQGLNWYPSPAADPLLDQLASYTGIDRSHLMVTAGSDEALRLVCDTFLEPGDRVVAPVPTYGHFLLFARVRGAEVVPVLSASPFRADVDAILGALEQGPRLLYLVNPTNPSGIVYSRADLERILAAAAGRTLVVVDEAYHEFTGESVIDAVQKQGYQHLFVTRTFSKAFALAALRVGYIAASPTLVRSLQVLHNPKSVGTLAQVAAVAALGDLEYVQQYVREVHRSAELLAAWFRERGHPVHVGGGNFLLVRVDDVPGAMKRLKAAQVYVRDRSTQPGLDGWIRVTLGTVAQTGWLISRLDGIVF